SDDDDLWRLCLCPRIRHRAQMARDPPLPDRADLDQSDPRLYRPARARHAKILLSSTARRPSDHFERVSQKYGSLRLAVVLPRIAVPRRHGYGSANLAHCLSAFEGDAGSVMPAVRPAGCKDGVRNAWPDL